MHQIYTTEGFVLQGLPFGEANRFYYLFTKDFGLITASAQGIRHLKSKLRYSLNDFSYSSFSLVKGKNMWRITGAERKVDFLAMLRNDRKKFAIFSRAVSLLKRLIHGEEKNEKLFSLFYAGSKELLDGQFGDEELKNFECLFVLRILQSLGYFGEVPAFKVFTENLEWQTLLPEMKLRRREALFEINRSLQETQL